MTESLLIEINNFLVAQSMAPSTFGRLAVNDGKLVSRLSNGGQVLPTTEERIRQFIAGYQLSNS